MRISSPPLGGKLPAALIGERKNSLTLHSSVLPIVDNIGAMSTQEDIARLLNLGDLDGSAFAEVISDYFDDREAAHDSSLEEDDFLEDTGMKNMYNSQKRTVNCIYHLRKKLYTDIIGCVFF